LLLKLLNNISYRSEPVALYFEIKRKNSVDSILFVLIKYYKISTIEMNKIKTTLSRISV